MTRILRLLLGLVTCSAVAVHAQTRAFNDTFTGSSTINANPASPVEPAVDGASYQQLSAKSYHPNPPAITPGNLRFGIVATSSGFNHIQALFTKYPVTLVNAGDYIELQVVFSSEGGILTTQANSTLFFGLHDAGQVAPIPGGMQGTVATATAGYAQTWRGYVNRIMYSGGTTGFYTRPAQTETAANNQDVLYNYASASAVGATATSTLTTFMAGVTYTEVFRITKTGATGVALQSSLYAGETASGTPLYTQSTSSTTTLTSVFDAFAIGWRATGSVASVMNIQSIVIATTGATTIVPEILTQPLSVTKTVGDSATFSVVADGGAGTTLAYQWFKDGVEIAGATSEAYTIASTALGDAGDYTVVVTDIAGSTTSEVATLTVTTGDVPPTILVQPAGGTILAGESHTFSPVVNGTTPLQYQWERSVDGGGSYGAIAAATEVSYTVENATPADAGLYRVVVTNAVGSATSDAAALAVHQAPVITTQPVGGVISPGGSLTLTVAGTGTPAPTYQWYKNGAAIAGATSASYVISSATGADTANYTVVLTNAVGSVTSDAASVAVVSPTMAATGVTPSGIRNPDTRLSITFNETPTIGVSGFIRIHDAATDAVVETIDLVAATALRDTLRASSTLSTQLLPVQKKSIGGIVNDFNYYPITVSRNTATIHPRNGVLSYGKTYYVTVEPGAFVNASGEAFAGIADAATWRFTTKTSGPAAGATALTVAADGTGDFDTLQAALDFIPAGNAIPTTIRVRNGIYFEQIALQSKHAVTIVGEDPDQTVIAYPNNNTFNNISGVYHRSVMVAQSVRDFTLANLTIRNTTPQNGSQAEAIVINGTNATASRNIVTRCRFYSYQDTVQLSRQTYVSDSTIHGDVDFLWGGGPAFFRNCDIRILRTGGYFTQIRNGSDNHGYVFVDCRFTAPAGITGTFFGRIDPAGFPYSEVVILDSVVGDAENNALLSTAVGTSGSSYRAGWWLLNNASSASAAPTVHNWTDNLRDASGAVVTNPEASAFTTMPTDATTQANYRDATWVLNSNMAGTLTGSWTPALAPVIVVPPVSQEVSSGEPATFTVAVVAIPEATYQWRKNGSDIAGATSASLTIPAAHAADVGSYTVVVTNAAGAVTSSEAALMVTGEPVAPVITTQPQSQLIAEGSTGTLSVAALGTTPLSYQWEKDGSPVSGATSSTYPIVNASSADAGSYRVTVTNVDGGTTSEAAVVTVKGIAVIAKSGYAAGVTGGGAGETVTVNTVAALKAYAEALATPYTIVVSGTIDLGESGRIKLQSNKTLRGATTEATILGTINISNADNVIVSNLNISANTGAPSTNDGITIASSTNVLVTKCTIYDCTDGNLDVVNGSDLVTISWCKFYYTRNNGHNFSNLVGSSDTDVGSGDGLTNYRVTWHHNWWSTGAKQRMIACRFGSAHMFNNYWDCVGDDYCTESRNMASMFSEHNYYDGVKDPLAKRKALPTDLGLLMTIGNVFDACTGSQLVSDDVVFSPPYSYGLDAAASVPAMVRAGAGNVTTDAPVHPSAAITSNSAPVAAAGSSVTLTVSPDGFTPTSYQWRLNNVAIAGANSATLELSDLTPSQAGNYTVVLGRAEDGAMVSSPLALEVKFAPTITTQPVGRSVTVGDAVSFSIEATGDASLAYQWSKDGESIPGATSATLELDAVTTADAGEYVCVVSNGAGSATSQAAVLAVQKAAATVVVTSSSVTYDGTAKAVAVTTTPAGLPVFVTYNGAAAPPVDAGTYDVVATVDHVDYSGSASGTLTISPAPAVVTLGGLAHTYDGTLKTATVTTSPAGLPVTLNYDGGAAAPTNAGSYSVVAVVTHPNYAGSATGVLTIEKASATITLSPLEQGYDGTARTVTATTAPAGLAVTLTYNGSADAPIYPGTYAVVASIDDANFAGALEETLDVTITALVKGELMIGGELDGSLQLIEGRDRVLEGRALVAGDVLLPGLPYVAIEGSPTYVGTKDAGGAATPTDYTMFLKGRAVVRYVVRRVDALALPVVTAPAAPAGTRSVTLNRPGDKIGDPATLRDLTLNRNAGSVAVPPGVYGSFIANGGTAFVFGIAGTTTPVVYELQQLTVNGNASVRIVGPVVLKLANGTALSGTVGATDHPEWLELLIAQGDLTLNSGSAVHGVVAAPASRVTIGDNAAIQGRVSARDLSIADGGLLEDIAP